MQFLPCIISARILPKCVLFLYCDVRRWNKTLVAIFILFAFGSGFCLGFIFCNKKHKVAGKLVVNLSAKPGREIVAVFTESLEALYASETVSMVIERKNSSPFNGTVNNK